MLSNELKVPINQVLFEYNPLFDGSNKASLSWHLTTKEKNSIKNNIKNSNNQESLKQVVNLLRTE